MRFQRKNRKVKSTREEYFGKLHKFCGHLVDIEDIQHMVNLSWFYLKVDSCKQYGLLTGPKVNVERCIEVIAAGRKLKVEPDDQYIDPELLIEAPPTK